MGPVRAALPVHYTKGWAMPTNVVLRGRRVLACQDPSQVRNHKMLRGFHAKQHKCVVSMTTWDLLS